MKATKKILGTATQAQVEETLLYDDCQSPIEIPDDLCLMTEVAANMEISGDDTANNFHQSDDNGDPKKGVKKDRKSVQEARISSVNSADFDDEFFNEFAPSMLQIKENPQYQKTDEIEGIDPSLQSLNVTDLMKSESSHGGAGATTYSTAQ